MGIANVGDLSLGQWAAICRGWTKAHNKNHVDPPSEDEFDAAVLKARGV